jgi:hypothetical protein
VILRNLEHLQKVLRGHNRRNSLGRSLFCQDVAGVSGAILRVRAEVVATERNFVSIH